MNNYFYRLTVYDEFGSVVADESGDFDRLHEGVDQAKEDIEIYDNDISHDNGYNHYESYNHQDKGLVIPDKDHRIIVNPQEDFKKEEEPEEIEEYILVPVKVSMPIDEDEVVVATLD